MSFLLSNKQGCLDLGMSDNRVHTQRIFSLPSLYFYMWRVFLSLSQTYAVPAPLSYSSPSPVQSIGHVDEFEWGHLYSWLHLICKCSKSFRNRISKFQITISMFPHSIWKFSWNSFKILNNVDIFNPKLYNIPLYYFVKISRTGKV